MVWGAALVSAQAKTNARIMRLLREQLNADLEMYTEHANVF